MSISEYARANGLDPDTALTHMLLFTVVEATRFDEDWQRRTFKTLLDGVDARKLAESIRELAKELVTPGPLARADQTAHAAADNGPGSGDRQGEDREAIIGQETMTVIRTSEAYVHHHDTLTGVCSQLENDTEGRVVCCRCGDPSPVPGATTESERGWSGKRQDESE